MSATEPLPPLAPGSGELDWLDAIEQADHQAPDEVNAWEIESKAHAEVLMRRLRRLRRRADEVRAQAQEWRQPIEDWERDELARIAGPIKWYEGRLETYAILLRAKNERDKTLRVPSGEVPTRRPTNPTISIDDADVVVEWALHELRGGDFDAVIDTRFVVKTAEFKQRMALLPTPDGWCTVCGCELVEPAEGEDGPWTHLAPGDYDHVGSPGERLVVVFRRTLHDGTPVEVEIPGVSAAPPATTATVKPRP